MKTSLLVALVAGGQTTFEQTSSIFPLFLLYFIFLSGLLFSLSLSTGFIVASVEKGCLQAWLRRNNCCCSQWLLLKSLKFVLPLLRIEGYCWKCKGVADAGGCALGKEERKKGFPLLLLLACICSQLLELLMTLLLWLVHAHGA
jgi:hypothetical protein